MLKWIILSCLFIWASGAPSGGEDLRCKACHTFVEEVRDLIHVKDPQAVVVEYLKEICEKLPSEEKDVCYFFLQDHSKQLFDKLAADLTPDQICQNLPSEICRAPTVEVQPVEESAAEEPYREPEEITVQENGEPETMSAEENVMDFKCELCKLAINWVDKQIKSNRSVAAINSTLEEICKSLSGEFAVLCNTIEPYLIEAIQKGIPADEACKLVTLCTVDSMGGSFPCEVCYTVSSRLGIQDPEGICSTLESCQTEGQVYTREQDQTAQQESLDNPVECELCKVLIKLVDDAIENNKTVAAINSTLLKICSILPDQYATLCNEYEPEIIKVIEQGLDPGVACRVIKLCSGDNIQVPCDVCYSVAEKLGIQDADGICSQLESCQSEAEAYQEYQEPENLAQPEAYEEEWEPESSPEEGTEGYQENQEPESPIHEEAYQISKGPKDDLECDVCTFILKFIEDELNSSKSIAAINKTLERLCNSIPDAKIKSTCIEYEPQIIALTEQGIPPIDICTLVKACTGSFSSFSEGSLPCDVCQSAMSAVLGERGLDICFEIPGVCLMPGTFTEEEPEPPRKPVPECEVCEFMVQSVVNQVESFGKDKVVEVFERICGLMPEQEQQFCAKYGSHVIRSVQEGVTDPRQTCVAMTVCRPIESQETEEEAEPEEEPVVMEMEKEENIGDDGKCEVCKLLLNIIDQIVKDNKTMADANATLYRFCDILPTTLDLQKICYSLVPQIEKFAKQGLDPTQACEAANFCPKNAESTSMTRKKRSGNQTPLLFGLIKNVEKQLNNDEKKVNGVLECTACKIAVQTLNNFLKENKTEQQVNDTVYEICLRLTGQQLIHMCLDAVPKLLPLIKKGLDPDQVCQAVGICDKTSHDNNSEHKLAKRSVDLQALENLKDLKCDLCEAVLQLLDAAIEKNATKEKINATVYKICDSLPGTLKDLCMQYAPDIVKAVENGVKPDETCQKIGLCSSLSGKSKTFKKIFELSNMIEKKKVKGMKKDKEPKDLKCDGCIDLVKLLDNFLERNASRDEINSTIYKLCDLLSASERLLCLAIAPKLVNQTEHGFNATKVCQMLKLCDNTTTLPDPMQVIEIEKAPKTLEGSIKCELCDAIMKEVDDVLAKNSSFKKINETVYGICDRLPKEYKEIVNACYEIAPSIVEVIAGGVDPDFVCEKLGVCKEAAIFKLKPKKKESPVKVEVNGSPVKCGVCMGAVETVLEELLENFPKIQRSMKNNVCKKLPELYQAPCAELWSSDLGIYWKQFLGYYNPSVMCDMVGCEEEYIPDYPEFPSKVEDLPSKEKNRT